MPTKKNGSGGQQPYDENTGRFLSSEHLKRYNELSSMGYTTNEIVGMKEEDKREIIKNERYKTGKVLEISEKNKERYKEMFPDYEIEKVPVRQLLDDNKIKNDNATLNTRKEQWGDNYDEYFIDHEIYENSKEPIRAYKENNHYKIDDGRHRAVAIDNEGYRFVEILVRKGRK